VNRILQAKTPEEYDKCKSKQLVDCYLAWALLHGVDTAALFVVRQCNEKTLQTFEANQIFLHDSTNMQHGLNGRK